MSKPRIAYARRIGEIRAALAAAATPLTLAEIAARCPSAPTTIQVGCALHAEVHAGRAEHSGARGQYRYRITDFGRAVAAEPNRLRRSGRRRSSARRALRLAALVADAMREARAP